MDPARPHQEADECSEDERVADDFFGSPESPCKKPKVSSTEAATTSSLDAEKELEAIIDMDLAESPVLLDENGRAMFEFSDDTGDVPSDGTGGAASVDPGATISATLPFHWGEVRATATGYTPMAFSAAPRPNSQT